MRCEDHPCHIPFAAELAHVGDSNLQKFVLACFDRLSCPYFWQQAHGQHHKDHPRNLVEHTRRVAYWSACFADNLMPGRESASPGSCSYEPSKYRGIAVAAALLHDVMRQGDPAKDRKRGLRRLPDGRVDLGDPRSATAYRSSIVGRQGIDLAEAIFREIYHGNGSRIPRPELLVMYAVSTHLGIWTRQPEYRPANIEDSETRRVCEVVATAHLASLQPGGHAFLSG